VSCNGAARFKMPLIGDSACGVQRKQWACVVVVAVAVVDDVDGHGLSRAWACDSTI